MTKRIWKETIYKINSSSLKTELGMLQTQNLVGINLNIKYLSNPPGKFLWIFS